MRSDSLLAWGLAIPPLTWALHNAWFRRKFVGQATPGTLGAVRLVVFAILAYFAWTVPLWRIIESHSEDRQALGVIGWARNFAWMYESPVGLSVLAWITVVFCLLAMIGLFTRITAPLAVLFYLVLAGLIRSVTTFNHAGIVPLYCAGVLCFTRCADGFSVDRWRRIGKGLPVVPGDEMREHYAWGRYLVWAAIVLPYLTAGLSKIVTGGWDWWHADNLKFHALRNAFPLASNKMPDIAYMAGWPDWIFAGLGILTLVAELGAVLLLFSPLLRMIAPFALAGMHIGIVKLMGIHFWDLVFLQLLFFDWRAIRLRLAGWITRRRSMLQVLYDGHCSLCLRTVAILRGLDLFQRIQFISFRQPTSPQSYSHTGPPLDPAALEREMHVIKPGKGVRAGYDGYVWIASVVPILWLVYPLLRLPGISAMGRGAYAWVARKRYIFHTCDTHCALPRAMETSVVPQRKALWKNLLMPGLLATLVVGQLSVWQTKFEYYPFSGFRMFSERVRATSVDRWQVYVYRAAGNEKQYLDLTSFGPKVTPVRRWIRAAFSEKNNQRQHLVERVTFYAQRYNRTAHPAQKMTRVEIIAYRWNFAKEPHDPNFGVETGRIVIPIP